MSSSGSTSPNGSPANSPDSKSAPTSSPIFGFIGVLDIYGFEVRASFEEDEHTHHESREMAIYTTKLS